MTGNLERKNEKQGNPDKLTCIKSDVKLPGQSQEGDNPSSTLTSRVFTGLKKIKISAQRYPCFIKKSQTKDQRQVNHSGNYSCCS